MLRSFALLLLAAAALAEDRFPAVLKAFERARENPFAPGAHARVLPALEEMVGLKDARAVPHLAGFMVQSIQAEQELFSKILAEQKRGANARRRIDEIATQIRHLDVRLRAGATEVAPRIDALKREEDSKRIEFEAVMQSVDKLDRGVSAARDLREKLADGCVSVLRAVDSKTLPAALIALRRSVDIAKEQETLVFVRVLRGCARVEAATHLIDIVTHPTIAAGPRRQAISALAGLPGREGVEVLIKLWERDPAGDGTYVQHALSLAAKRPLENAAAAREWAKSLK